MASHLFLAFITFSIEISCAQAQEGPQINPRRFSMIKKGMSEKQVIEILRARPGNYATADLVIPERESCMGRDPTFWTSNEADIEVWFDKDRKVTHAHLNKVLVIYFDMMVAANRKQGPS